MTRVRSIPGASAWAAAWSSPSMKTGCCVARASASTQRVARQGSSSPAPPDASMSSPMLKQCPPSSFRSGASSAHNPDRSTLRDAATMSVPAGTSSGESTRNVARRSAMRSVSGSNTSGSFVRLPNALLSSFTKRESRSAIALAERGRSSSSPSSPMGCPAPISRTRRSAPSEWRCRIPSRPCATKYMQSLCSPSSSTNSPTSNSFHSTRSESAASVSSSSFSKSSRERSSSEPPSGSGGTREIVTDRLISDH